MVLIDQHGDAVLKAAEKLLEEVKKYRFKCFASFKEIQGGIEKDLDKDWYEGTSRQEIEWEPTNPDKEFNFDDVFGFDDLVELSSSADDDIMGSIFEEEANDLTFSTFIDNMIAKLQDIDKESQKAQDMIARKLNN